MHGSSFAIRRAWEISLGIPRRLEYGDPAKPILREAQKIHLKVERLAIQRMAVALQILARHRGAAGWKPQFERGLLRIDEPTLEIFRGTTSVASDSSLFMEQIHDAYRNMARLPARQQENMQYIQDQFSNDPKRLLMAKEELTNFFQDSLLRFLTWQSTALRRLIPPAFDAISLSLPRELIPPSIEVEDLLAVNFIYVVMPDESVRLAVDNTFNLQEPSQVRMKHSQLAEGAKVRSPGVTTFTFGDHKTSSLWHWLSDFTSLKGYDDVNYGDSVSKRDSRQWECSEYKSQSGHYLPGVRSLSIFRRALEKLLQQGFADYQLRDETFPIIPSLENARPINVLNPGVGWPQMISY